MASIVPDTKPSSTSTTGPVAESSSSTKPDENKKWYVLAGIVGVGALMYFSSSTTAPRPTQGQLAPPMKTGRGRSRTPSYRSSSESPAPKKSRKHKSVEAQ